MEKLDKLMAEMEETHREAIILVRDNAAKLKGEEIREYKNRVTQYDRMYTALEDMKVAVASPEAVEKLLVQQSEVLNKKIDFEREIIVKIKGIK